jgi:hypothetical protein
MDNSFLPRVHEHLIDELQVNTRTDRIFIITCIVINIAILSTNSALAAEESWSSGIWDSNIIVMIVFVLLLLVVNLVAEIAIIKGRQTRTKLINCLIRMYEDLGVDGYYDRSLLQSYKTRYNLFMLVVLATGLIALVIPFIVI